jgi:hypothetical protein
MRVLAGSSTRLVVAAFSIAFVDGCNDGAGHRSPQQGWQDCSDEQRAAIRSITQCFSLPAEQAAQAEESCSLSIPHVATLTNLSDPAGHFPNLKLWYSPSTTNNRTGESLTLTFDSARTATIEILPRAQGSGDGHSGLSGLKGTIDESCEVSISSATELDTDGRSFGAVDVAVEGTFVPGLVPQLSLTLSGGAIPGAPITYGIALAEEGQGAGGGGEGGQGGAGGGAGGGSDQLTPENLEALTGAGLPATCQFVEERNCSVAAFTAALTVRVSNGTVELVQMPGSQATEGLFHGGVKFATTDASTAYDEIYLGEFERTMGTDRAAPLTVDTLQLQCINTSGAQGSLAAIDDAAIAAALDGAAHTGNTSAIDTFLSGTSDACVYLCNCTFDEP